MASYIDIPSESREIGDFEIFEGSELRLNAFLGRLQRFKSDIQLSEYIECLMFELTAQRRLGRTLAT
jgi:hypothetical protein